MCFCHSDRRDRFSLSVAVVLALYAPMCVLQLFTWIVFAIIMSAMCYRSCHKDNRNNAQYFQFKKNLGILVLLFIFLGLPWLFIVAGSLVNEVIFEVQIGHALTIIYALQGPVLFAIRVARLKEVRRFWKRVLFCQFYRGSQ